MKTLLVFLGSLAASLACYASEVSAINLEAIGKEPLVCSDSKSFDKLFEVAVTGEISGVSDQEILSEINENSFIQCPKEFLTNLKQQPKKVQKEVVGHYFGVVHAPWELGSILNRFKNDPILGGFVKTEFSGFLEAKAPK